MSEQFDAIEIAGRIIRNFEGLELSSYIFPGEENLQATIGYGHAIPLAQHPLKITKQQAVDWLSEDVRNRVLSIKAKIPKKVFTTLSPFELGATTSWAYNCKGWSNSETFDNLVDGEKASFIEATSQWIRGENKKILAGLVRRRACERHVFTRGSIEEVVALDWYMSLVPKINENEQGNLDWQNDKLIWTPAVIKLS